MSTKAGMADNISQPEDLFAEFNETLRSTGLADYGVAERCPLPQRQELLELMRVAHLAYHALRPDREDQPVVLETGKTARERPAPLAR